jgi:ClpP class serine protease
VFSVSILDLLWLFFIFSSLQPMLAQRYLTVQRARALRALEKRNGSRAVTLINRREGFAFLGIPFGGFIDIDDSEALIRVIESTGNDVPIDLVLHTPGGLVLAAEQIAAALGAHPARVTVYVPHYAMSGGTLIALAAESIVMSPSAVLGPVDPQLGEYPVASILEAVGRKDANEVDDRTLILADMGRKARHQVGDFVEKLLARHLPADQARSLAQTLSEGRWTHDFPIDVEHARKLGLPVSTDLPEEVRSLMALYPQPRGRRPAVEYVPGPAPDGDGQRRWMPSPRAPARPARR